MKCTKRMQVWGVMRSIQCHWEASRRVTEAWWLDLATWSSSMTLTRAVSIAWLGETVIEVSWPKRVEWETLHRVVWTSYLQRIKRNKEKRNGVVVPEAFSFPFKIGKIKACWSAVEWSIKGKKSNDTGQGRLAEVRPRTAPGWGQPKRKGLRRGLCDWKAHGMPFRHSLIRAAGRIHRLLALLLRVGFPRQPFHKSPAVWCLYPALSLLLTHLFPPVHPAKSWNYFTGQS